MADQPFPYTQNRELSWLRFNQRVLEEAADTSVPLLERLKFVAIFTSNLDEFYMVRCGSLYDLSLISNSTIDKKSGMRPSEQLDAIFAETRQLYAMRDKIYKNLNRTLEDLHFSQLNWKQLTKKQTKAMARYFDEQILPLLSPQIIDSRHPFPHLANKELYIFVELLENGKRRWGILPIPHFLERIVRVPDTENQYLLLETLIFHNLDKVFMGAQVRFKTIIRVTRNADINLDEHDIDEDEDYRGHVKKILKRRNRLAAIRLEYYRYMTDDALNYLTRQLHLKKSQVFMSKSPLEMSHLFNVIDFAPKTTTAPLLYPPFRAQIPQNINPLEPLIPQVLKHDWLLFYPYQDIDIYIKLLQEASLDPNVVSIRITIYRLAKNSKIVAALCKAAENGKDVTVLMELRARFDESHNIKAAEQLEEAGCSIIYGFEDFKVHSKICLITVRTRRGVETITQIGTGNYNEKTSHQYTDISYITSNPAIGRDAIQFFQNMNMANLYGGYEKILTSPKQLKQFVMRGIDEQIRLAKEGKPAQCMFKLNAITDLDIIEKMAEASQAGVKIIMVIRGICCLLPGLPGYTENIEIYSIVGRFLEHSRIYVFGKPPECQVYISSADFMTRNTERRVEVAVPVENPIEKKTILDYFAHLLADNTKRRQLMPNGQYVKIDLQDESPLSSQEYAIQEAMNTAWKPEQKKKSFFDRLFRR